jgi:hypothetical protein
MNIYRPMSWVPDPPEIDAIVPESVRAGSPVQVTITGRYFTSREDTDVRFVLGGSTVSAVIERVSGVREPRSTMVVSATFPAEPRGVYQIVAVSRQHGYQWQSRAGLEVTS